MKKTTTGSIDARLARFLFCYRATPNSTTGVSPVELLMRRRLRTDIDQLHPDLATKVYTQQQSQKRIMTDIIRNEFSMLMTQFLLRTIIIGRPRSIMLA